MVFFFFPSLRSYYEGQSVTLSFPWKGVKAPMSLGAFVWTEHWLKYLPLLILLNEGWSWPTGVACAIVVRIEITSYSTVVLRGSYGSLCLLCLVFGW